jgi:triacylglycerol esterase/lipase EstA (alpha/beta hydrolase family)
MQKVPSIIGCVFLISFILIFVQCEKEPNPTPDIKIDAHVVLLHGLRQSSGSMEKMEESLLSHGYTVVNVDYSSTSPIPWEGSSFVIT